MLKDRQVRLSVVRKDFEWFFAFYLPNYITYETAPFQKEMMRVAANTKITLAAFTAFRGSGKSTILTLALPLWAILGKDECKNVVIVAQTQAKGYQYLQNIKSELENNKLLRSDLGPFQEEKAQWGSTALVISRFGAKITVVSMEQGLRGYRFKEHRPDLIILDDVEDMLSVKTREGRDRTWDLFTSEIIPAGTPQTRIIVVGNLLHEDCLLRRLERRVCAASQEWVYREYPLLDEDGVIRWPGKYPTRDAIEQEREKVMDEYAWHREYLLKIISTEDQIIKPEWIHYYDNLPSTRGATFRYTGVGIDLAISERDSADFTSMVSGHIYGYDDSMEIFILPGPVNQRLTFPDTVERAMHIANLNGRGNTKLYIEDVGYQASLIQELERHGYRAYGMRVHGQDKAARLRLVTRLMKEGRVRFPRNGCQELIEQLLGFGKEKYDDLCDAFAILILKAMENGHLGSMALQGKTNLL
jgi:predicted phage terminase large subunit-like protein